MTASVAGHPVSMDTGCQETRFGPLDHARNGIAGSHQKWRVGGSRQKWHVGDISSVGSIVDD